MKFIISNLILIFLTTIWAFADLPQDSAAYKAWELDLLKNIETQSSLPSDESIPKLGRWIMQLSLRNNREKGDRPVFRAAQTALLAIPGHAEYYERNIKAAQQRYEKAAGPVERGPAAGKLSGELTYGFQTLAQLPSPETVRVLGDFLSDHKGVDENGNVVPGYIKGTGPACTAAANALMKLPLKNKPMPHKSYLRFEDVRPWQLWYQQIKAGTRTFSFEGDPNIYNLAGPVTQAHEPNVVRPSKREVKSEISIIPPKSSPWTSLPVMIAAALTIIFTGVYFLRRNKQLR